MLFDHAPGLEPSRGQSSSEKDASNSIASFAAWFNKSLVRAQRNESFQKSMNSQPNANVKRSSRSKYRLCIDLSRLISDTRDAIDTIAKDPSCKTNPFDSLYSLTFQLTFRMLGCNEIANDAALQKTMLSLYELIENSATPATVLTPWWFPTLARLRRSWGGFRMYMIIKRIADTRRRTGRREDDTLQMLIDDGDGIEKIVRFIIIIVCSGQANSGLNIGYMLAYLTIAPLWMAKVRAEIGDVANKFEKNPKATMTEKIMNIPLSAWDSEFPVIELCLRETIRLTLVGTAFRWNSSPQSLPIGRSGEVVPPRNFAVYHFSDIHRNPNIYKKPQKFDPSRFLSDREEDTKVPLGYVGWGTGRHVCLGMRVSLPSICLAFDLGIF